MLKKIKNIDINYIDYGEGNDAIVLLHGWGQNIEMMKPVGDRLSKQHRIIIIDLPGFGLSEEPKDILTIYDYVECIKELIDSLKVNSLTLIGHSFGGKISLAYASKYHVNKLITFGSPFKKEINKLSLKTRILKILKKVPVLKGLEAFAKKHIGSTDYRQASEIMRKIMVEHVNLDITEDVKKIKCPTLLIWGTNDEAVSIDCAYELEKLISDAGVVEYPGCSHYAYLERLDQTINVLNSFLGDK
ncbi:MAG: alpha/beta hydrolase [Firmicutes bacterium]|nr:alpha/beta hydrolase [Bacillota bacterium]